MQYVEMNNIQDEKFASWIMVTRNTRIWIGGKFSYKKDYNRKTKEKSICENSKNRVWRKLYEDQEHQMSP